MTDADILNRLGALTTAYNQLIDNAKTNDELPQAINANPSAKVRTSVGGVSEIITIQHILDLAIAIIQPSINRFTVVNGYDLTGQDLTINADWVWYLSGVMKTNPADVVINIPFASAGLSRIDIIVATSANTFLRIPGTESAGTPVAPETSLGVLQATFLLITDDSISAPIEPSFGQYVGSFETRENLLNSVRRSENGDFGFISNTGVFEIAHFNGTDWSFYSIGGQTAHNQMFIWNTGDPLTFNLDAGFSANYLTIDNAPLRKVTDALNTFPVQWSQSGVVATIDPSVVTDETLVDGSIVYFTGIKTV